MIAFGIPHGMELLIILAVVLLLFGHRIPGMARSLGSGITEFKRGLKDGDGKGSKSDTPPSGGSPADGQVGGDSSNDGSSR
ncbi:MAG: twin-arginine translocase TatA/TatE family subunit [Planctomycetes bacterium]|nr:twin-arginine translocase TatA/TatE family subunit [Planctomycetota bacterium]